MELIFDRNALNLNLTDYFTTDIFTSVLALALNRRVLPGSQTRVGIARSPTHVLSPIPSRVFG